jgi:twitching motility protein PilT
VGSYLDQGDFAPLCDDEIMSLVAESLSPEHYQEFLASGSADVGLELDGERYRGGLFRQHRGLGLALRPIRTQIPTLQELGLPRMFTELVKHRTGLVLMTGATGSGKSSTQAALIGHLNSGAARHVITLEDPIEFVHSSQSCLVHQREVGRDVASFASGLRAALRENPDVILVGEIRDVETAVAALAAAETGHLVMATLHSRTSDTAIERLVDLFPAHRQDQARVQLASVLRSVVSQLLLPGRSPGTLVPAFERLVNNVAVAAKIREGRWHQLRSEIMKGRSDGMLSIESCLAELVQRGRITAQTALEACDTAEMHSQLQR